MTKLPQDEVLFAADVTDGDLGTGPRSRSQMAVTILAMAFAGGMGWGIRGQYGHETGAMIAGVLIGFTALRCFALPITSLAAARAVAMTAVGIAFGGSMTYGQTIGLTHDAPLIGHWGAFRWGMLGLSLKGGIWIGYAGLFLGMALGGKRYRPLEMSLLLLSMLLLLFLGIRLLNSPFDPANRVLPPIYFSDDWRWEPDGDLKPRPECWGGLLLGWIGLLVYVQWFRGDRLARNMALAGLIAGGIGFPSGQSLQAYHAANPQQFQVGLLAKIDPFMNWWNMMEISFGAIAGAGLAIGLWWNRAALVPQNKPDRVTLPISWELFILALHIGLLVAAEFTQLPVAGWYLRYGVIMSFLPLIGILGGRFFPYLMALWIVAIPVAGKTLRELAYRNAEWSPMVGWLCLIAVPLTVALAVAIWFAVRDRGTRSSFPFIVTGLVLTTWLYFGWNWAFFRSPWPWMSWTGRTPSGVLFWIFAFALTAVAMFFHPRPDKRPA